MPALERAFPDLQSRKSGAGLANVIAFDTTKSPFDNREVRRALMVGTDREREIVIRADLPNGDLGYPTTIEYAPGELFCCYYGQEPDGVTCIQGTRVTLS